jgi:NTP pyrophosphatase (non-canonical NTP hydrolase)
VNTEQAIKALKKLHGMCPANDDGDEMSEAIVDAVVALHAQQERENAEYVVEATGSEAVHILKLLKEDAGKQDPKPLTLALQSVQAERNRQDEKWGDQSGNHPFEWMSILGEEYGELCEAVNETFFKNGDKPERGGIDKMRKEAVQVAAVAVALIEALDKSDHGNIHDNPELVKEGNE